MKSVVDTIDTVLLTLPVRLDRILPNHLVLRSARVACHSDNRVAFPIGIVPVIDCLVYLEHFVPLATYLE